MRMIFLSAILLTCASGINAKTVFKNVLIDDVYYSITEEEYSLTNGIKIGTAAIESLANSNYIHIPDSIKYESNTYPVTGYLPNSFSDFKGTLVLKGLLEPATMIVSRPTTFYYFKNFNGTLVLTGDVSPSLAKHLGELDPNSTIVCDDEKSMKQIRTYWSGKIETVNPVYYIDSNKIKADYTSVSFSLEIGNPKYEYSVWFDNKELKPSNGLYTINGLLPGSKYIVNIKYLDSDGKLIERGFDINTKGDNFGLNSCTPNCSSIKFKFRIPKTYLNIGATAGIIIGTDPYFNEEGHEHDTITVPLEESRAQYKNGYYYIDITAKELCPKTNYYYQAIITNGKYTNYISHNGREIETSSPNLKPIYKSTQRTYELTGIRTDSTDIALDEWNISVIEGKDIKKPYKGYKKSGLRAGQEETLNLLFEKDDKQFKGEVTIGTRGLNLDIDTEELSPSSVTLTADWDKGDAADCIKSVTIKCTNGESSNKKSASFTGMVPESDYTAYVDVAIDYRERYLSHETATISFTTPKLEIKCEVPRNVNPTTSLLAAQTNLADCETGVGFEWKKYDAPASLAPSSGYGILYDGRLEGRVLNLQSDKYYNCRAFYEDANKRRYYSDWVTFDPSDFSYFDPVIHSYDVSEITATSACLNGMMMPGSDEVLSQGFEIRRADSGKTVSLYSRMSDIVETIFTQGLRFKATAANLEPSTTYIYRSFVKTSRETYYGEEVTFTTIAPTSGIEDVNMTEPEREIVAYYNLQGYRIEKPSTGIVIVKYSDGSTSKILIKD